MKNIAISIPFGIITFLFYKFSDFLYFYSNLIFPDYGEMSAGGAFAVGFILIVFFAFLFNSFGYSAFNYIF